LSVRDAAFGIEGPKDCFHLLEYLRKFVDIHLSIIAVAMLMMVLSWICFLSELLIWSPGALNICMHVFEGDIMEKVMI
jgi:hypothetical protein